MKTACFIGHRTINQTEELEKKICEIVEKLIVDERVNTFLFGSRSRFNDLCLELVTRIKEKHPHIKRIYVRAEYPYIDENYTDYLLQSCDDTYFPERIKGAGRAVYVERNYEMIEKSDICIFYLDDKYNEQHKKSGTRTAFDYARSKRKTTYNLYTETIYMGGIVNLQ